MNDEPSAPEQVAQQAPSVLPAHRRGEPEVDFLGRALPPRAAHGVSVVVPALNEVGGIARTLSALRAALDRIDRPSEILVVDDGSSDGTGDAARAAGADVLEHPQPGGYGRALRTGIRAARHEVIVICDADGTYPAEEVPRIVELMDRFDMVVGQRTGSYYIRRALLSPMRTSFLLLTSFVTGKWIPDPNSGLRGFRRADVLPLLHRLPRGFSFTTTLTLLMTLEGRFIHFHPIAYHKRIGRSKVRVVRDALRVAQTMTEVVLSSNPLKMFILLASPVLLAALLVLALAAWVPHASVIATVLFATAVLVFTAGMLSSVVLNDRIPR